MTLLDKTKHMRALFGGLLLASGLLLVGGPGQGWAQPSGRSALGALIAPQEGRIEHFSSHDRSGGNADYVRIAPGETHTLVDYEGTGAIRRWWVTLAPRGNATVHRHLIVRCYWDGEQEPSVEVPISDFFGVGFGQWTQYTSLPLSMTSGGYNSYWPMPFEKSARITVENTSDVPVERFYYNIDAQVGTELPEEMRYFHAQFRKTTTQKGQPVTLLETEGRGHYVGTLLSMQPTRGTHLGYLEGDPRIFVDGEATPSIVGTGTEDYFSAGWYYETGEYSAPYHGLTIKEPETGRVSTYRWHIEDPIPFDERLRVTVEHGGRNTAPGVTYASVAYWYQTHPHPPFPPLPDGLMPVGHGATPEIEAETLVADAQTTGGTARTQDMAAYDGKWGGGSQLWWVNAQPGDRLTIPLEAPADSTYRLVGFFTRAPDYGIVRISVNGQTLTPLVDGYNPTVAPSGPISFGKVRLQAGTNELVVELIGHDARAGGASNGDLVGIDGFTLE